MQFLTYGRVSSDGVLPHEDYLREFPFLGVPNAQPGEDTAGARGESVLNA
jgi:hypothetical protein